MSSLRPDHNSDRDSRIRGTLARIISDRHKFVKPYFYGAGASFVAAAAFSFTACPATAE